MAPQSPALNLHGQRGVHSGPENLVHPLWGGTGGHPGDALVAGNSGG